MGHKMMDNEKEEEQKERRGREDKKEERACHGSTGIPNDILVDL